MALPVERWKDSYQNWRYNPFSGADMAVDKEEDDLVIPGGAPFVVQLLESPRKNTPTTVIIRAYDAAASTTVDADSALGQKVLNVAATAGFGATDTVIVNRGGAREEECVVFSIQAGVSLTMVDNLAFTHTGAQADAVEKYYAFAEVAGAPAQSQFRVDYPVFPANGEGKGTGLVEFNAGDASKVIRVNYKATGSPMISEILDTKVSYPAGDPVDHQILGFVSGAPAWRYNPIRYFHEGPVIYNAGGEDESCLLFRFKKTANEGKVFLELKGAKLHQGYYTELIQHNHGAGTYAGDTVAAHLHGKGTLVNAAIGTHTHAKGTLAADAVAAHSHAKGTLAGSQVTHQHAVGTLAADAVAVHSHAKGTLAGSQVTHIHGVGTYSIPAAVNHTHAVGTLVNAAAVNHNHNSGTLAGTQPNHTHGFTGLTGYQSTSHTHIIDSRSHSHPSEYATGGNWTGLANGCDSPTQNENAQHTHAKGSFAVETDGNDAIDVNSGNTGAGGGHNHVISGATATGGAHNHTISNSSAAGGGDAVTIAGNTADGGGHGHTISGSVAAGGGDAVTIAGSTATGGGHGHVISGVTAADGDHNHVISGSTATSGNHGHTISGNSANVGVMPKTYPDQLKIYINGVDKTTEVLALTGLTEFGDGTTGHAFVTTGSGEMDISTLVSTPGIHQIKITEPIATKGGRVLLHCELY